jgi:hypothetical protein
MQMAETLHTRNDWLVLNLYRRLIKCIRCELSLSIQWKKKKSHSIVCVNYLDNRPVCIYSRSLSAVGTSLAEFMILSLRVCRPLRKVTLTFRLQHARSPSYTSIWTFAQSQYVQLYIMYIAY